MLDFQNISEEEIDAYWDWEISPEMSLVIDYDTLYHYYSRDSEKNVFRENLIYFRLSKVSAYSDKTEGIVVNDYYASALHELKEEKSISDEQYELFKILQTPSKLFLPVEETNGIEHWSDTVYETYSICFSTVKNDPYMFQNYGGKGKKEGYCFHF